MKNILFTIVALLSSLTWTPVSLAQNTAPPEQKVLEAKVVVWNREIAVLRAYFEDYSPAFRAQRAQENILAIPESNAQYEVTAQDATVGNYRGAWITVDGLPVFGVLEDDVNKQIGETFPQYKQRIINNVEQWLVVRSQQHYLPQIMRGVGFSFLATLGVIVLLVAIARSWHWLFEKKLAGLLRKPLIVGGINLTPYLSTLGIGLLKLAGWTVVITLVYLWLAFVLAQFPYSTPWANQLSDFFVGLFRRFSVAFIRSIPKLATVFLIFLIARMVVRVITAFFRSAELGLVSSSWLAPETARATRRLLVMFIWVFALVIAYPYIPGSDTDAFKGVSVMVGLMVSLGSAALVAQVVGGLLVVYTGAFRTGEFIRVDEHEGTVQDIGMLSTRIKTNKQEEIIIPNSVMVSATTINYSRFSKSQGAIVATELSIGYDVPWRQVKAMLQIAVDRTAEIRKSPPPRIIQRTLADFYIVYHLWIYIDRTEKRYSILSDLHANILDVFNEYGVQIMSPNFVAQPESPVIVPIEDWHLSPSAEDGELVSNPESSQVVQPPAK